MKRLISLLLIQFLPDSDIPLDGEPEHPLTTTVLPDERPSFNDWAQEHQVSANYNR